jgi:hypothetical protein
LVKIKPPSNPNSNWVGMLSLYMFLEDPGNPTFYLLALCDTQITRFHSQLSPVAHGTSQRWQVLMDSEMHHNGARTTTVKFHFVFCTPMGFRDPSNSTFHKVLVCVHSMTRSLKVLDPTHYHPFLPQFGQN